MKKFKTFNNNKNFNSNKSNPPPSHQHDALDIVDRESESNERRLRRAQVNHEMDQRYGFQRYTGAAPRLGWLFNMHPTDILDSNKVLVSAVEYYFLEEDGGRFRVALPFSPYFYLAVKPHTEQETMTFLTRKYGTRLSKMEVVEKENLDLPNHLIGLRSSFLKLSFHSTDDLLAVRKELMPRIKANRSKQQNHSVYHTLLSSHFGGQEEQRSNAPSTSAAAAASSSSNTTTRHDELMDNIVDIREYDVPYHVRVSIDIKIFVGQWYAVSCVAGGELPPQLLLREDVVDRPDPVVLAYDIETTKLPLKFPDPTIDEIMMISYMLDGQGYLICNREIIAEDVEDFEFTPKPEFAGPFVVWNEPNEEATLRRFFDHIHEVKPNIFVTYNGDFFDWPFVEARALVRGIHMEEEIGFSKDNQGEYKSRPAVHMDCFRWVKRDSYLPVGAQGLKAVAKAKLRYDPVEVDPEDMCRLAREEPHSLANYSVSDAVATYYLYMKYVHPFVFALCTIIPMEPDEVLRKGSGTLCEALLMVQAHHANIVFPNKQEVDLRKMSGDGHLIDQETYVGGHVEALESGVFRADIPCRFRLVPEMCQTLRRNVRKTMQHALEVEEKIPLEEVTNFEEICAEIESKLGELQEVPHRMECPVIYHLDVAAMYPNIILTNRLQPSALVRDTDCAACDFNQPGEVCQRRMQWMWRADLMSATRSEYYRIQAQLEQERFPGVGKGAPQRAFHELSREEQSTVERKRLTDYCRTAYKKVKITRTEERTSTVCQRENAFYVDTVRAFRDRRYIFKELTKEWKKKADHIAKGGDATEVKKANALVVLYDSLQLAHKCILNSFYGYVMRRGARWYSMEMAGIVCHQGAHIITRAREIVEQIGRPLELDTDGIWCVLPASFPENFVFRTTAAANRRGGVHISYPGAMLNVMVQEHFSNEQYHQLVDGQRRLYQVRRENSIFFEVDGPYLAMILPASKEEGKKLKKRYAVFNFDKSLAELKGFEVKRNGELQLIKIFQSSVFEAFLKGQNLPEVYQSVAKVADYWLDVLHSRGRSLPDTELFELISENRSMSRKLADYGGQKSTSISTAKRLAEFLGDRMVKDAGLVCRFVVSQKPDGAPVTERAIPLAIFQAESAVKRVFLRKWLKNSSLDGEELEIRNILDWQYYIDRLGSCIQKIITIPAALQHVANPVPRVQHPDWLHKRLLEKTDTFKQRKITDLFNVQPRQESAAGGLRETNRSHDIEDLGAPAPAFNRKRTSTVLEWPSAGSSHSAGAANNGAVVEKPIGWQDRLSTPAPDMGSTREEFLDWLKFHQTKWRIQRELRHLQRRRAGQDPATAAGDNPPRGGGGGTLAKRFKSSSSTFQRNMGISTFLSRTRCTLFDQIWQVIQVVPLAASSSSSPPGVFKVWLLLGGNEVHSIRLTVPRVFYVNQRIEKDPLPPPPSTGHPHNNSSSTECWQKVHKTLPRSHPVLHLYEYRIDEDTFQRHQSALDEDLLRPDVAGVYELQVPLLFRLLAQLGCLWCVDRKVARDQTGQGGAGGSGGGDSATFKFEWMQFCSLSQHSYLANTSCSAPSSGLSQVHVFHLNSAKKQIVVVTSVVLRKSHILWVDASKARTPAISVMTQLYRQAYEDYVSSTGKGVAMLPPSPDVMSFQMGLEVHTRGANAVMSKMLSTIREESRCPLLVVVQSSLGSATQVCGAFHCLNDYPLVALPLSGGQPVPANIFHTLDWQKVALKQFAEEFVQLEEAYQNTLEHARYLHIPVGNVPFDRSLPAFGCDLFYARHLWKQNHLLWCSQHGALPDFGGKETFDQRLMCDSGDQNLQIELNQPGCYGSVCVELEICGLPVHSLLVAARVLELEGGSTVSSLDHISTPHGLGHLLESANRGGETDASAAVASSALSLYDESAACSQAFKIMRHMVLGWVRDVAQHQNPFADMQIVHLYEWLSSSDSLLFDPAMKRTLMKITKKVFCKLVEEIGQLGGHIVFGDFAKVIVCAKKTDSAAGLSQVDFMVSSICSKELFRSLDMQCKRAWQFLLWEDYFNYCGVKIDISRVVQAAEESEEAATESDPILLVDSHWHMARYLSAHFGIRSKFYHIVATYVTGAHKIIRTEFEKHKSLMESDPTATNNSNAVVPDEATAGESAEEEAVVAISSRLGADASLYPTVIRQLETLMKSIIAPELYAFIIRLQRRSWNSDAMAKEHLQLVALEERDSASRSEVPLLPRYQLEQLASGEQYSPLLDFIKFIGHILLLDSHVEESASALRRDLLRLIHVSEFSPTAGWTAAYCPNGHTFPANWTGLLTLKDVGCSRCNYIHNLDLSREVQVSQSHTGEFIICWPCPACAAPYSNSILEERLCRQLDDRVTAHLLQDICCVRCGGIQERTLSQPRCECAASAPYQFSTSQSLALLRAQLHAYRDLATACGFAWLAQKVRVFMEL